MIASVLARWGRRRHRAGLATCALTGLAVLAGGCATVPTTGQALPITEPSDAANQGAGFPQLIPAPPGKGWSPKHVVSGFLAASASFAGHHSVARQYLIPEEQRSWDPGWAVTVVTRLNVGSGSGSPSEQEPGQAIPPRTAQIFVSGLELASLNTSGQYEKPPAGPLSPVPFNLAKVHGQWRIINPPARLLLSNAEFHRVYQPRDLYYFATGSGILVPDPVFVPLQATATDLATGLVAALKQQPVGYLAGATETRFPAGTRLTGPVRIEGTAAIVNLGGAAATAGLGTLDSMAAQLVWTLTSSSYGPSAIASVRFQVNGQTVHPYGSTGGVEVRSTYGSYVPATSSASALYFVGQSGGIQKLPATGTAKPSAVPGDAGTGTIPVNQIAIAPSTTKGQPPRFAAGISPGGRTVYIGALAKDAKLQSWRPGGVATSLSWDPDGDLWIASSQGIWLLQPGAKVPVAVDIPLVASRRVLALRVAPDGVRLAMIVRSGSGGAQVMVGAIARTGGMPSVGTPVAIGTEVADPSALSWYDADDLAVLSQAGTVSAEIKQVPVNGGQPVTIGTEQRAISLATAGSQIVAGLPGGRLVTFTPSTDNWKPLQPGKNPVYPG